VDDVINLYFIRTEPIDHAIVADDDLPNVLPVEFTHNSAGLWEPAQSLSRREEPLGKVLGVARRVECDVARNVVNIRERIGMPGYSSQCLSRSRASSSVTLRPASASARRFVSVSTT